MLMQYRKADAPGIVIGDAGLDRSLPKTLGQLQNPRRPGYADGLKARIQNRSSVV